MIHIERKAFTAPRKPQDLCRYIDEVYEQVMGDDETRHRARRKEGLYKEFLEELTILCIYSKWKFPDNNVLCELVLGNQGYDALIKSLPNDVLEYEEYIEITCPIDGYKEHESANEINEKGSAGEVFDYNDFSKIEEIEKRIIGQARKKSLIDYEYPDSSLIIALNTYPYYDLTRIEHFNRILYLVQQLREIQFKVKAVYILLLNADKLAPQDRIFPIHINDNK